MLASLTWIRGTPHITELLSELEVAESGLFAGQDHLRVFLRGMFHRFTLICIPEGPRRLRSFT